MTTRAKEPIETAGHRAEPVCRDEPCGLRVGEAAHRRLAEEGDHDAANGDFSADIGEDGSGGEPEMAEVPG